MKRKRTLDIYDEKNIHLYLGQTCDRIVWAIKLPGDQFAARYIGQLYGVVHTLQILGYGVLSKYAYDLLEELLEIERRANNKYIRVSHQGTVRPCAQGQWG